VAASRFNTFRSFLLRHPLAFVAWRVLLRLIGRIVFFWLPPRISKPQIDECYRRLRPGDIIGVYSRRFPTGLFLPKGKWGVEHSAIYIGHGLVVEAVTPRVRVISLRRFLRPYDRVVVGTLWPSLCSAQRAIDRALTLVDRSYDVLFGGGKRFLYCHETVKECMEAGGTMVPKAGEFWVFDDLAAVCESVEEVK
jgi:hypothetical protein